MQRPLPLYETAVLPSQKRAGAGQLAPEVHSAVDDVTHVPSWQTSPASQVSARSKPVPRASQAKTFPLVQRRVPGVQACATQLPASQKVPAAQFSLVSLVPSVLQRSTVRPSPVQFVARGVHTRATQVALPVLPTHAEPESLQAVSLYPVPEPLHVSSVVPAHVVLPGVHRSSIHAPRTQVVSSAHASNAPNESPSSLQTRRPGPTQLALPGAQTRGSQAPPLQAHPCVVSAQAGVSSHDSARCVSPSSPQTSSVSPSQALVPGSQSGRTHAPSRQTCPLLQGRTSCSVPSSLQTKALVAVAQPIENGAQSGAAHRATPPSTRQLVPASQVSRVSPVPSRLQRTTVLPLQDCAPPVQTTGSMGTQAPARQVVPPRQSASRRHSASTQLRVLLLQTPSGQSALSRQPTQ